MKKDALVRYILRNAQDSCVEDLRKAAREKLVVRDGNGWIVLLGENGREMIIKTHVVLCVGLMMMRVRRHVWDWMYLFSIFLDGTLDHGLD